MFAKLGPGTLLIEIGNDTKVEEAVIVIELFANNVLHVTNKDVFCPSLATIDNTGIVIHSERIRITDRFGK